MNRRANPFLTVVRHPDGWHVDQVATLLNTAAGMDLPTLRLKLRQKPPMIVSQLDHQAADLAIRALLQNGGDAMAVTLTRLESLGPTIRIQRLSIASEQIVIEPWRGEATQIAPSEIEFLIRAHLATKSTTQPLTTRRRGQGGSTGLAAYAVAGLPGYAAARAANLVGGAERPTRKITTSDKLDIHLTDGRVFQIDGDRFSYDALGDMKGHADKINMDRMRDLLSHLAPHAIVDGYFSLWRAPAGYQRLRLPRSGGNEDASFAFYSRWSALVYRHAARPR